MRERDLQPKHTQILETERLLLRTFQLEDAPAIYGWASDEEVTRYLRFKTHTDLKESITIAEHWIKEYSNPYFFQWAIVLKESLKTIGSIGIQILSFSDKRGELGYCLHKKWWNRGYTSEALKAVIHFGFTEVLFHRLEACHSVNNGASGKVMQKAGMRWEAGPLHHYYYSNQSGYQDVEMYALTRENY